MNIVLIYNAKAGSARTLREWKRLFRLHGHMVTYSFSVDQKKSRKLRALIEEGVTVAVIGGDGTLNSLARLMAGTPSTLLPLPGGTFNHFVRDVMKSADIDYLITRIDDMRVQRVDVGYVNDELFLNNSNIGLYPFSLIERKKAKKIIGKWPAALLSALDQLAVFRRHKLVVDGVKMRSPFVFVGNNVYEIESAIVPERRVLDAGLLSVMIATSESRIAFVSALLDVLKGSVRTRDDFEVRSVTTLRIDSPSKSVVVSYDGEVTKLMFPLEYRVKKRALRVMRLLDE